ncbi:MAG: CoB--CoM heterodisulfide reductase iron-sulfur subunit B family protein [Thermodesulfobacteriota bacterium]|nr:CoB--CoM heterodisulfide reductase iron-sulfur subunit B family protein [Thermodesulfobacteriota bacterium]
MDICYYPGCTLKTKAKNLNLSTISSLANLDIEAKELSRWNCCGVVPSLASDDLLRLIAPVRNLARAKEEGYSQILTVCSMCYQTLAMANQIMQEDMEKRDIINNFMEEEGDYSGEVKVVHLLGFLRDEVGWDRLKIAVKIPLVGLKVAPYYGCTLIRPRQVGIEPLESLTLFRDFITAIGGIPVDFPSSTECCSSYQVVSNPEISDEVSSGILKSAEEWGADILISSCPLCEYNLGLRKREKKELPTLYFTQILALSLGLDEGSINLELNSDSAINFFKEKFKDVLC